MRGTIRILLFSVPLIAFAASALDAQTRMRFGDAWPTTEMTPAQRIFAESYLKAVTGSDIDRYKRLLHPGTRACVNKETAEYFADIFKRRTGEVTTNPVLTVEKLPEKFAMFDAMESRGWKLPARPTHAFYIDLGSTGPNQFGIGAFAVLEHGAWYEVLPCPSAKALEDMRQAKRRNAADSVKAIEIAATLRDPLRAELLALMKDGRSIAATKHYAETAKVELAMALRVIRILEKDR